MDALARAFQDADRLRSDAKSASPAVGRLTTPSGIPTDIPGLGSPHAQFKAGSRGWAFTAIKTIAERVASLDIHAGRAAGKPQAGRKSPDLLRTLPGSFKSLGDHLEPLGTHPFLSSVDDPNPMMVRWQLISFSVMGLLMTGRSFIWHSMGELWPLPASWIKPADSGWDAWEIRPQGHATAFEVPGSEIIPFTFLDPANPFGTLSPLQSQALAVAVDESIQTAQHRAFKNGIHPTTMIRAGRLPGMLPGEPGESPILEPEQRQELISTIKRLFQGAVNYNEPLIVDGLIESVEKLSTSPSEMDFMQSADSVKARIFQAFSVNPIIAGQVEGANRASSLVAENHFNMQAVNPLVELLSQTLTKWGRIAFNDPSLTIWIEPAEARDSETEFAWWKFAASMGFVTGNEFRRYMNLPDLPGLDEIRDQFTGEPITGGRSTGGRTNGHSQNRILETAFTG
jgi:phage portal protein BeeE